MIRLSPLVILYIGAHAVANGLIPNCPSSADLAPCTCDDEGINCGLARDAIQLHSVLNSYVAVARFRDFWMSETRLTSIENQTFARYEILRLHLQHNQLESISENAFGTRQQNFTTSIELNGNRLTTIPLVALERLNALMYLDMSENLIETIPDDAFSQLPSLSSILLRKNRIRHLGKKAFNSLSNIVVLHLQDNHLTIIQNEAFDNPNPFSFRLLNLQNNQIQRIEPGAFSSTRHFGELILANNTLTRFDKDSFQRPMEIILKKPTSTIIMTDNPIVCDDQLMWLLQFTQTIRSKIVGMHCNGKHISYIEPKDLLQKAT